MQSATLAVPATNKQLWAGRIISAFAVVFLIFDGVIKVMLLAPVVDSFALLDFPAHLAVGIGALELLCIAVYLIPRTSVLGAVLLTGYLGGAVATHVRAESELFSLVFPFMIGALIWGGLWLRDRRLRVLIGAP